MTQACPGTPFRYPFHQVNHGIGHLFAQYIFGFRGIFIQDRPVFVFDTCHHDRLNIHPLIGKGAVGPYHFIYIKVWRTQRNGRNFGNFPGESQVFYDRNHWLRAHPVYQLGSNGIYRIGQCPFQAVHFAGIFPVGVFGAPGFRIAMLICLDAILVIW